MSERRHTESGGGAGVVRTSEVETVPSSLTELTLTLRPGCAVGRVLSSERGLVLETPLTLLGGPAEEVLAGGVDMVSTGDTYLLRRPGGVTGVLLGLEGEPPGEAARRLYGEVLRRSAGLRLHRVWNFVPGINDINPANGLENYRAFNAGRHRAFLEAHGPDFRGHLPAASALGVRGGRMIVVFSAGREEARHFENPEQVPACEYPEEWGELPPAFARGTRVDGPDGPVWHLSGTASIKGHTTRGDTFAEQMAITLENVRLMRARMDVPEKATGRWKVFIRHAEDLPAARAAFAQAFPGPRQHAMFIHTGICRACLLVEIEGAFSLSRHSSPSF